MLFVFCVASLVAHVVICVRVCVIDERFNLSRLCACCPCQLHHVRCRKSNCAWVNKDPPNGHDNEAARLGIKKRRQLRAWGTNALFSRSKVGEAPEQTTPSSGYSVLVNGDHS